jgi:hypothetical protein
MDRDNTHTFVFDFRAVFESDIRNAPLIAFRHMRAAGQRMMSFGPEPYEGHFSGLPGITAFRLMAPNGSPSFPFADVLETYVANALPPGFRVQARLVSPMIRHDHIRRQSVAATTTAVLVVDDGIGFWRRVNISTMPATMMQATEMGAMLASIVRGEYRRLLIVAEPHFPNGEKETPWASPQS